MSIDNAIKDALRESVSKSGQPKAVAEKLIKWFEEVVLGNEKIEDKEAVLRRLESLCEAVQVEIGGDYPQ